jgi:hypothetical protein
MPVILGRGGADCAKAVTVNADNNRAAKVLDCIMISSLIFKPDNHKSLSRRAQIAGWGGVSQGGAVRLLVPVSFRAGRHTGSRQGSPCTKVKERSNRKPTRSFCDDWQE